MTTDTSDRAMRANEPYALLRGFLAVLTLWAVLLSSILFSGCP